MEEWSWMELGEGSSILGPISSGLGQISIYPNVLMSAYCPVPMTDSNYSDTAWSPARIKESAVKKSCIALPILTVQWLMPYSSRYLLIMDIRGCLNLLCIRLAKMILHYLMLWNIYYFVFIKRTVWLTSQSRYYLTL